jgi:serine/threonine protein kinase
VQRLGNAVAAGSFGDVWKGIIRGESVAIKVLRIYAATETEKYLKVSFLSLLPKT